MSSGSVRRVAPEVSRGADRIDPRPRSAASRSLLQLSDDQPRDDHPADGHDDQQYARDRQGRIPEELTDVSCGRGQGRHR